MWEYVHSVASTLLFVGLLIAFFYQYRKNHKSGTPKSKESLLAGICWIVLFVFGLVLQIVFQFTVDSGSNTNGFMIVIDSIDRTIGMFAFGFKQSNIVSTMWDRGFPSILYAIIAGGVNVAAGVWTYYFVVRIFFNGIKNRIRIETNKFFRKGTHYIVVGCNDRVNVFLSNLSEDTKKSRDGKRDTFTIITGDQSESSDKWYKKYLERGFVVIKGVADRDTLIKAGLNLASRPVCVVAWCDSDENNLAVAEIVTNEIVGRIIEQEKLWEKEPPVNADEGKARLQNFVDTIRLEARIEYKDIERAEHFKFAEKAYGKINFFNPYELQASRFFYTHPITDSLFELLDYDKGRLKGTFDPDTGKILKDNGKEYSIKHLFLGFGDNNYQMLRYSASFSQLLGVDYKAVIYATDVDKKVPIGIQAKFMHQAPGLFGNLQLMDGEDYLPSPNEKYSIDFKNIDVLSTSFYDDLKSEIVGTDKVFVYIALGDDKVSTETALELRQMVASFHYPLNNIKIYVRAKQKSAFFSDEVLDGKTIPLKIEYFGVDKETFTVEEIVAMQLDVFSYTLSNQHHGNHWYEITEEEKDSNRAKILHLPTALGMIGYKMVPGSSRDDIAKYERICGITEQKDVIERRREGENKEEEEKDLSARLEYIVLDKKGQIPDTARNNLAQLEHLRWDVFSLVTGWTKKPIAYIGGREKSNDLPKPFFNGDFSTDNLGRKNDATKQHACITTYDGLIRLRRYQAYLSTNPINNDFKTGDPIRELSLEEKARRKALSVAAYGEKIDPKIEGKYDTIAYDYDVLDDLPKLLSKVGYTLKDISAERKS